VGVPQRGPGQADETTALPAQESQTASIDPERLTSPGTAMGSMAYMSPEQARGERLDGRTDLFSFGAVLYEMATGRPAFGGATSTVIFHRILAEAPQPPLKLNPSLPPKLEEIINKALEKDRELRCQTAAELRADLKRLKRDTDSGRSSVGASPLTPSPSPQRRGKPKSLEPLPSLSGLSGRGWSRGAGPGEGSATAPGDRGTAHADRGFRLGVVPYTRPAASQAFDRVNTETPHVQLQ